MTSGNCVYCNTFQADLEGHSTTYHHMTAILPTVTLPPTMKTKDIQFNPTPPDKIKGFCPECGQKLKSKWYIESFFLIMRYSFTAFWIGALAGAGWLLQNGFHH